MINLREIGQSEIIYVLPYAYLDTVFYPKSYKLTIFQSTEEVIFP